MGWTKTESGTRKEGRRKMWTSGALFSIAIKLEFSKPQFTRRIWRQHWPPLCAPVAPPVSFTSQIQGSIVLAYHSVCSNFGVIFEKKSLKIFVLFYISLTWNIIQFYTPTLRNSMAKRQIIFKDFFMNYTLILF